MAVGEATRHQLYSRLGELLGPEPTSTLTSLLPPVGRADVATKEDLRSLEQGLRDQIAGIRVEIADVRVERHDAMRRLTVTLVGAMVSIAGVTFAATALV